MAKSTVSLQDLRRDFGAVRRKIKRHGKVTVLERGEPVYVIQPVEANTESVPDYYDRVTRRQPRVMSQTETDTLHEDNRGDC